MTTCSVLFAGCREAARVRRVHRLEPELREGVVRGSIRRRSSVRRRVLRGGHGRAQAVAAHQARPVRAEHTHDYPPSHSNTQSPPNHHPITTQSPPNHHPITTQSPPIPPNHHPITTQSLTTETHPSETGATRKARPKSSFSPPPPAKAFPTWSTPSRSSRSVTARARRTSSRSRARTRSDTRTPGTSLVLYLRRYLRRYLGTTRIRRRCPLHSFIQFKSNSNLNLSVQARRRLLRREFAAEHRERAEPGRHSGRLRQHLLEARDPRGVPQAT